MAVAVSIYRALLIACPREFRSGYGAQAATAFEELLALRTREGGRVAALAFLLAAFDAVFALRQAEQSYLYALGDVRI